MLLATATAQSTVYLIRHGEKLSSGNGISSQGEERAQCLVNVFSASSSYNIGHIMAETPRSAMSISGGWQQCPYDTVLPLAESLGLDVDTSCERDDADCVQSVVDSYTGDGKILICWEHNELTNIVTALGDSDAPSYPDDSYNLIWTDP
ncbi:phosphoglycerate mutase family protein [Penicillium canariense]|uniref:Phosphoglycerate mutase family protein n=1 Tax=Penicillium canariense TaxID=189055 RepID=A0A9W9HW99_9EURO|nr:phosphoglycerate mutase family protein [Penicillium canariense]KAJ5157923.1 phosphoglycerate mutase family protein [Penicillium canariense]